MFTYLIPLYSSFVSSSIWGYIFLPILALAFIATVPCILRYLLSFWRG